MAARGQHVFHAQKYEQCLERMPSREGAAMGTFFRLEPGNIGHSSEQRPHAFLCPSKARYIAAPPRRSLSRSYWFNMCRICGRVVKCIFDTMPSRLHHVSSRR